MPFGAHRLLQQREVATSTAPDLHDLGALFQPQGVDSPPSIGPVAKPDRQGKS